MFYKVLDFQDSKLLYFLRHFYKFQTIDIVGNIAELAYFHVV